VLVRDLGCPSSCANPQAGHCGQAPVPLLPQRPQHGLAEDSHASADTFNSSRTSPPGNSIAERPVDASAGSMRATRRLQYLAAIANGRIITAI